MAENDKQEYQDRVYAYRASQAAQTAAAQGKAAASTAATPARLSHTPMLEKLHVQTLALSLAHPMTGFPNTRFRSGSALEMMIHLNQQSVHAYEQARKDYKARVDAHAIAQAAMAAGTPNAPATLPALPPPLPAPPVEYRLSLILHLYQSGFTLNGGSDGSANYHPYSKSTAAFLRQLDHGEIPAMLGTIVQSVGNGNQAIAGINGMPPASAPAAGASSSLPPIGFHWYDGCIFAELRDYRSLTATMRAPAVRRLLLRPTLESIQTDALMLAADNAALLSQSQVQAKPEPPVKLEPGVDAAAAAVAATAAASTAAQSAAATEEADTAHFRSCVFTAEALMLRLTKRSLCLDPSPRVCQIANLVHYNRGRSFVPKLAAREARARTIELLQNVGETEEMMAVPPPPQRSIRVQQADLPSDAELLAQQQAAAAAAAKFTPGNGWYEHEIEVDEEELQDGPGPMRLRAPAPLPATASHAERQAHLELLRAYLHAKTRLPAKLRKVPIAAAAAPAAAKSQLLLAPDDAEERKEGPPAVDSSMLLYETSEIERDSRFHSDRRMVEGKGAGPDLQCLMPLDRQMARGVAAAAAAAAGLTDTAAVAPIPAAVASGPVPVSESHRSLMLLNYASFIHHHSQNLSNHALNRTLLDPVMKGGLLSGKNFALAQGVPPAVFTEPAGANGAGYPSSQPFVTTDVARSITYPQAPLPPPPPPVANGSMPAAAPAASSKGKNFVHISSTFHKVAPGDRPVRNPTPRPDEWTVMLYSPSLVPPSLGAGKAESIAAGIALRSNPRQIMELLVRALPATDARPASSAATQTPVVFSGSFEATLRLWTACDPTPGVSTFALGNEEAMRRFVEQFKRQAELDYRSPMLPTLTVVQQLMPQFSLPTGWYIDEASAQYLRVGTAPPAVAAAGKPPGQAVGPASISRGPAPPPSNASYPNNAAPGALSASAPTGSASYPPQASRGAYPSTSTLPPNTMPSRGVAAPPPGAQGSSVAARSSGGQAGYYAPSAPQQPSGSYHPSAVYNTQSSSGHQVQPQYSNAGLVSTHTSANSNYPSGAVGQNVPRGPVPPTQQQQQRYSTAPPPQQQVSQLNAARQGSYPQQQQQQQGYSNAQYAPSNQSRAPSSYVPSSGGYSNSGGGQATNSNAGYPPLTPGNNTPSSRGVSGAPSNYNYPPANQTQSSAGGGANYNYASPQQQMRQVAAPNSGSNAVYNSANQYRGSSGGETLSWTDSQGNRYTAQQPSQPAPQHQPSSSHARGYSGGGGSTAHPSYSTAPSPSGNYAASSGYPPQTPPSYSSAHTPTGGSNHAAAYSNAQYNAAAAAYAASGAYQSNPAARSNTQQQQQAAMQNQQQLQQHQRMQQQQQQQQYYSK